MQTIAELLMEARRELEKVCARVDDQVEKVAQVAAVIDRVAKSAAADGAAGAGALRPVRSSPAETHALREAARTGASALAMTWNIDGSAEVRVNGGEPFHVQAKPAALLRIIAAPGGREVGDGLIGWRSSTDVAAALSKHTGRVTTPRNLTHIIYKLRRAFRDTRQNWFLIQTDRHGAVRFAVRSDAAESAANRRQDGGARW